MAITLYSDGFYISPYVFSVFVVLEEKGIPYRLERVPLQDKAQERPEYRDRAITGRVPAIDHDGFWLAESAAIDNYLEDAFPAPHYRRALPEDVRDRARARMVLDWIRSDLMPIREERATHTMFYERAKAPRGHRDAPRPGRRDRAVRRVVDRRHRPRVHAAAARPQRPRAAGAAARLRRRAMVAPVGAQVDRLATRPIRPVLAFVEANVGATRPSPQ
jgi:glutathione S-transferase